MKGCFVGIDLGGTKTIVASADEKGRIVRKEKAPTPLDLNEGIKLIEKMVNEVSFGDVISIGCACGGPLDWKKGVVSPLHMPQWRNVPLKEIMEKKFSCQFYVDVDTNVAAMGEYFFGEASKYKNFVYITLSTGMGGALLVGGKIHRGNNGEHPEFGHQSVNYILEKTSEKPFCECGAPDCLEGIVSGSAIKRLYGKSAENIADQEIIEEIGYNLGQGLRNITALHAPDAILIGGGVAYGLGERLLGPARELIETRVRIVPKPVVELASLGYDSALIGSVAAAMRGVG